MAYLSEVFPLVFSYDASRRFLYQNDVVKAISGKAERNGLWSYPLHVYGVPLKNRLQEEIENLFEYYHACGGRLNTFPLLDPFEDRTCGLYETPDDQDQALGTATAGQTVFPLVKNYTRGGVTRQRRILDPITAELLVAVDDAPQTITTDYTVTNGIVTFNSPLSGGEVVTWGGRFYVPCAFDEDQMEQLIHNYSGGQFVGDTIIRLEEDRG